MSVEKIDRMDMRRYAVHALFATSVVVAAPIVVAYRLGMGTFDVPWYAATGLCTVLSLALGRIGAMLWQRHSGSRDVVFDDLLVWGFVRRLVNQRRVLSNAERLAGGLTHAKHLSSLRRLARALEAGDPYTHGHSDTVARHAYMIARAMKLPKGERDKIRLAGALHDVGKLRTPRHILTKPGRLTDEEFDIIKRHPADGAEFVAKLGDPELTAIVRHHHERMDGTGYPDRLPGAEIPLGARIIAVADTFDAITSNRPYRPIRKHKEAIAILTKEAGTQLDPAVVKAFIAYYTGRRAIRLWLSISSAVPRVIEASIPAAQRAAANAAAVGMAVAVTVGGAALRTGDTPERTTPFAVDSSHDHAAMGGLHTDGSDLTHATHPGSNHDYSRDASGDAVDRSSEPSGLQAGEGASKERGGDSGKGAGGGGRGERGKDGGKSDPGDSGGGDTGSGDSGGDTGSGDSGGDTGSGDTGSGDSGGDSATGGSDSGGDAGDGDGSGGGGGGGSGTGDGGDGGGLLDIVEDVVDQVGL